MEFLGKHRGDGSLINLMKHRLSVLFLITLASCASSAVEMASDCVARITDSEIVRTDEANQRFFLVGSTETADLLVQNSQDISACFAASDWEGRWSLSLFTDKKFAGYMHEPNITPFHEGDLWSKAYLAEFDGAKPLLTLNPTTNPKEVALGH